MRAIISLLTAATLLIEGTAGWCCHPPGQHEICSAAPANALDSGACCEHHARTTSEERQKPSGPCQDEPTCQGICVFLPSQKTLVELPQAVTLFDIADMLPMMSADTLAAASLGSFFGDPFDAVSPVRLHLLHRLLLI